jgi:hypothetical protein
MGSLTGTPQAVGQRPSSAPWISVRTKARGVKSRFVVAEGSALRVALRAARARLKEAGYALPAAG